MEVVFAININIPRSIGLPKIININSWAISRQRCRKFCDV